MGKKKENATTISDHLSKPIVSAFFLAQETLNEEVVRCINEHKDQKLEVAMTPNTTLEVPMLGLMNIPCPRITKMEMKTTFCGDDDDNDEMLRKRKRKRKTKSRRRSTEKEKKGKKKQRHRRNKKGLSETRRRARPSVAKKKKTKQQQYRVKIVVEDDSKNNFSFQRMRSFLGELVQIIFTNT